MAEFRETFLELMAARKSIDAALVALGEVGRLRAEVARVTRERDAALGALVYRGSDPGDWYVEPCEAIVGDAPSVEVVVYPSQDAAIAAVRRLLGLDP